MNSFKTFVLMLALFVVFMLVGQLLGGRQGMVLAFVLAAVMNFVSYFFSDKIVLKMYGAQEAGEEQAPQIFRVVRNLAQKAKIPMPKIYVIPSESPNAFATGRDAAHAAVAFTESILRLLDEDELEAVIGHELSHITHHDILIGMVAATIAGAITMLASMARWAMIFGGGSRDGEGRNNNLLTMLVMFIVAPLAAMLIQMAISRSREYLADEGSAVLTGKPLALASALKKLEAGVAAVPMAEAAPATAHLFIVHPVRESMLFQLFSTHPSSARRIARLEEMAGSMRQGSPRRR